MFAKLGLKAMVAEEPLRKSGGACKGQAMEAAE